MQNITDFKNQISSASTLSAIEKCLNSTLSGIQKDRSQVQKKIEKYQSQLSNLQSQMTDLGAAEKEIISASQAKVNEVLAGIGNVKRTRRGRRPKNKDG